MRSLQITLPHQLAMSETSTVFFMSHAVYRYASSTWFHRACHQQESGRDYHYWGRLLSGISAIGQLGTILEPGAGAGPSTFNRLNSIIIPLIMHLYRYQQLLHLLACLTLKTSPLFCALLLLTPALHQGS